MTRKYCSTLLRDTLHNKRPDWRTLAQTQNSKILYDGARKSNTRAPFPAKIKSVPSFTRGRPAALFSPQHQIFSANAYSLVVFDAEPNEVLFKAAYGEFIASCFKLDETIIDEMEGLIWCHDFFLQQSMNYDSINNNIVEIVQRRVGSKRLRSTLAQQKTINNQHGDDFIEAANESLSKLRDLFNTGWN